jgi:hypothetical protein
MKCNGCDRLWMGENENHETVYICFPKGTIIEDTNKEFDNCVFRR